MIRPLTMTRAIATERTAVEMSSRLSRRWRSASSRTRLHRLARRPLHPVVGPCCRPSAPLSLAAIIFGISTPLGTAAALAYFVERDDVGPLVDDEGDDAIDVRLHVETVSLSIVPLQDLERGRRPGRTAEVAEVASTWLCRLRG